MILKSGPQLKCASWRSLGLNSLRSISLVLRCPQKGSLKSHGKLAGCDTGERHSNHGTLGKGVGTQMPPTPRQMPDTSSSWEKPTG